MMSERTRGVVSTFLGAGTFAALAFALWFAHLDLEVRGNARVLAPLALAALEALALAALNLRAVTAALTSRRALVGLNVAAMVLFAGGIAAFVNVIAERHYFLRDWTFRELYSLSERTESVLDALPRPVRAHVIAPPGQEGYVTVRGLLDAYRAAAPRGRFEVASADPVADPERVRQTIKDLGIDPKDLADDFVVIFEAPVERPLVPRTRHVLFSELFEKEWVGDRGRLKAFKGEEHFTKAILEVTREKPTAVHFLGGHGELEPHGRKPDERLGELEGALRRLSYRVETLRLEFGGDGREAAVPEDCDVLVIAGPKSRFADPEIEAIRAWLDRGGRLLALGNPEGLERLRPGTQSFFFDETRLDAILRPFGLRLEPAYVYDPGTTRGRIRPLAFEPTATGIAANHPITRPLLGRKLYFDFAQPVVVSPVADSIGASVEAILQTAAEAVAFRDLNSTRPIDDPHRPDILKGPIALAAAATRPIEPATATARAEARVVAIGDANIAADYLAQEYPADLDLVLNAIAWLAERHETISIASKAPEVIHLRIDADQKFRIRLMALVELPLLCVAIALAVLIVRRSS